MLPCVLNPHSTDSKHMRLSKRLWKVPIVLRFIGNIVIRDLHLMRDLVVWHHHQPSLDCLLFIFKFLCKLASGNSALVDLLQIIEFRSSLGNVRSTAKDHCDVRYDPLPVSNNEFMSKRVRLHVVDNPALIVLYIHPVEQTNINHDSLFTLRRPNPCFVRKESQQPFQWDRSCQETKEDQQKNRVCERIVKVSSD